VLVSGEAYGGVLVGMEEARSSEGRGRVTSRGRPQFRMRKQDGGRGVMKWVWWEDFISPANLESVVGALVELDF
jgi:hypothetical protein